MASTRPRDTRVYRSPASLRGERVPRQSVPRFHDRASRLFRHRVMPRLKPELHMLPSSALPSPPGAWPPCSWWGARCRCCLHLMQSQGADSTTPGSISPARTSRRESTRRRYVGVRGGWGELGGVRHDDDMDGGRLRDSTRAPRSPPESCPDIERRRGVLCSNPWCSSSFSTVRMHQDGVHLEMSESSVRLVVQQARGCDVSRWTGTSFGATAPQWRTRQNRG